MRSLPYAPIRAVVPRTWVESAVGGARLQLATASEVRHPGIAPPRRRVDNYKLLELLIRNP